MKKIAFLVIFCSLALAITAQSNKVRVNVNMEVPRVGILYSSQVSSMNSMLSDTLIGCLYNTFPFLDFYSDSSAFTLNIKIYHPPNQPGSSSRKKMDFLLSCQGTSLRPGAEEVTLPIFGFGEFYEFPERYQGFVAILATKFMLGLEDNKKAILENILSHIPVTNDAVFLGEYSKWAVPFTYASTHMARDVSTALIELRPTSPLGNTLKIESIVNGALCNLDNMNLPGNYTPGCIILNPNENPGRFNVAQYRISVYIIKYTSISAGSLTFESLNCDDYNR